MAFYATEFIFDGIPSEEYGLIISSSDGESYTTASHNVELITDEIYRRHTPYFYGVKQAQMLDIPGSIRSINGEITQEDASYIQSWLFGHMTFKELRIVQPDMEGYYFKCFLLDPEIVRVGNIIIGFDFRIQLDSPFAYGEEVDITLDLDESSTSQVTLNTSILNLSNSNYYTYPKFIFEVGAAPNADYTFLKITNNSDNGRIFQMGAATSEGELNLNEYLIIDNDLQTILSYTDNTMTTESSEKRIQSLLNGYFFRFINGVNSLTLLYGNIEYLTIRYTPLKRIA